MAISNAGGADILNKEWNATNYTPAVTYYIGFRNNGTELTGGSYARIAVTLNTTNFPATSTTLMTNGTVFSTPTATSDWLEADEVAIFVASSGGTARYTGLLDAPFTLRTGTFRTFGVGSLRIRLI
jgi:hypothetical protein